MRNDLTDITIVSDRSDSMSTICNEAESGINGFIDDQKTGEGDVLLSLFEFDNVVDVVCEGVPVKDAPRYKLEPRGFTALLDAVGRAITQTGARLAAMPEHERPGKVVFVVSTDGQENASKEYTKEKIKQLVEQQQRDYSWHFIFLAADPASFADSRNMGFAASGAVAMDAANYGAAYKMSSKKVRGLRSSGKLEAFSDEERSGLSGS